MLFSILNKQLFLLFILPFILFSEKNNSSLLLENKVSLNSVGTNQEFILEKPVSVSPPSKFTLVDNPLFGVDSSFGNLNVEPELKKTTGLISSPGTSGPRSSLTPQMPPSMPQRLKGEVKNPPPPKFWGPVSAQGGLQTNSGQRELCKKPVPLRSSSIPREFYGPTTSTPRELPIIPTCGGQVSPTARPRAPKFTERATNLFQTDFSAFFQNPFDLELFNFFGLDSIPFWREQVQTENSYGVYVWYFPDVYLDLDTNETKSAVYIGESQTVLKRIIHDEYRNLLENEYCPNPVFQAAFKRAMDQNSGVLVYIIKDQTEMSSKDETRAAELAYLNDLNRLMAEPGRTPNLDLIITNLRFNLSVASNPRIEDIVPDEAYWNTYFTHCYDKYVQQCNRDQKEPLPYLEWRYEEEALMYRGSIEGFSNSENSAYGIQDYLYTYGQNR